jgi:hypothetical protein
VCDFPVVYPAALSLLVFINSLRGVLSSGQKTVVLTLHGIVFKITRIIETYIYNNSYSRHVVIFHFPLIPVETGSWYSAVGIATGYGLDDRAVGVRVSVGSRIFSSPCRPDRLWGPPSLLYNGYRRLFLRGVKLTTHLQLVPRSRKCGSIPPLPHMPSWRSA